MTKIIIKGEIDIHNVDHPEVRGIYFTNITPPGCYGGWYVEVERAISPKAFEQVVNIMESGNILVDVYITTEYDYVGGDFTEDNYTVHRVEHRTVK